MNKSLIIDVGMHIGKDTEFYLKKGFHVIAIEANPQLVEQAHIQFNEAIVAQRLIIYNVAIADHNGEVDLYVNQQYNDWSTTSKEWALRNEQLGTSNSIVCVKSVQFHEILKKHGIPYYLKIDIEGSDLLCLKELISFNEKPAYISIEASLKSFEEAFAELSLLWLLGYRKFKIINQSLHSTIKCQNPPLEGNFVDFHFDHTSSGPFGEETTGDWVSIETVLLQYRRLLTEQKYFGMRGKLYKTPIHVLYQILKHEPIGWYDIHAKLGEG